jgi:hypothetical protein
MRFRWRGGPGVRVGGRREVDGEELHPWVEYNNFFGASGFFGDVSFMALSIS